MNRAERTRIFRPGATRGKLDRLERDCTADAMREVLKQGESLVMQLHQGSRPDRLILDRAAIRRAAYTLAYNLFYTYGLSQSAIRHELAEGRAVVQAAKPAVFADDIPSTPRQFAPTVGLDWYERYALRLVGVQSVDALEAAKNAVAEGIREGLTQRQVESVLSSTFTKFSRHRLEMIVRTETARIYGQARLRETFDLDEVVGYEWSAILDTRACPICANRAGRSFPKDRVGGNLPPAHVQCRCMLLPVFAWEIEDGTAQFRPISGDAPPVQPGFGAVDIQIPAVDRTVGRLIGR